MTYSDALELALYAKEIFQFVTDNLAALLRDEVQRFPDPKWAREMLKQHARESQRISIPWIKSAIDSELRRRQLDNASKRKHEDQILESRQVEWWQAADDWAESLDDDTDATMEALLTLKPGARAMYEKTGKTVKTSRTLRGIAFKSQQQRTAFA